MNSSQQQQKHSGSVAQPASKNPDMTLEKLGDEKAVPMSKHALYDHPERTMDATYIRNAMVTKQCSPVWMYICKSDDVIILTCTLPTKNPKISGQKLQLVVGLTSSIVASGYPVDNLGVRGCSGPILVP